jgi:hypothetical protein
VIRLGIAWACYWMGDIVSNTTLRLGIGYRLYSRLMRISCELDKDEVIWKS